MARHEHDVSLLFYVPQIKHLSAIKVAPVKQDVQEVAEHVSQFVLQLSVKTYKSVIPKDATNAEEY